MILKYFKQQKKRKILKNWEEQERMALENLILKAKQYGNELFDGGGESRMYSSEYIDLKISEYKEINIFESQLGGSIFWPKDLVSKWPKTKDSDSKYLIPIAQVNLSDFPHIDGLMEDGILQFFLDIQDEEGLFDRNYKVIYWEKVDIENYKNDYVIDFSFLNIQDSCMFKKNENDRIGYICRKTFKLSGEKKREDLKAFHNEGGSFCNKLYDRGVSHHKVMGFDTPYQPLNRKREKIEEYILLFQIDSELNTEGETGYDVLWWDAGNVQFYIHPQDLKEANFEKVFCWISGG